MPDGGGIAAAIDYNLRTWDALGRFLHDGEVAIDNNHIENLTRIWAMGRKAWLFNSPAMLVRRDGETLKALIKRLDKAMGLAWSDDLVRRRGSFASPL